MRIPSDHRKADFGSTQRSVASDSVAGRAADAVRSPAKGRGAGAVGGGLEGDGADDIERASLGAAAVLTEGAFVACLRT